MFTTKVQTLAPATVSEASDETLIVMSPDARTQLLSQWWEHQRLNAGDRDERKKLATGQPREAIDAWVEVSDLVDEGSVGVVLLLADLVDAGPPDTGPSVVGSGPLEDLVHEHGDVLIDELETLGRQRPSFRAALSSVNIEAGWITHATSTRIRELVSVQVN